jgi:hypothetical protein
VKGCLIDAYEYGRVMVREIVRGARDGAGMIGLWFAYVMATLMVLSPLIIAVVIVIEATS